MEHAPRDEVGDDRGEGGSDGKQEPAVSLPQFAEAGSLSEDIGDVGGAVGYIGYDRQQEKTQSESIALDAGYPAAKWMITMAARARLYASRQRSQKLMASVT